LIYYCSKTSRGGFARQDTVSNLDEYLKRPLFSLALGLLIEERSDVP
jgi:hypothetical protein